MKRILSAIISIMLFATVANAQCTMKNTAFQGGEVLTYNLYYNWQFVWVNAGSATMSVSSATYKGKSAYKGSLITRGNSKADKFFVMRDTLLCYTGQDLTPMYFRKGAKEGQRYTVDEVWYNYGSGTSISQKYRNKRGEVQSKNTGISGCAVDMMSAFLRTRNISTAGWQKGHTISMKMADGNDVKQTKLIYNGKTKVKADNKQTYDCLDISFKEQTKGKWKEIIRFYVTDDSRHIPIRLDLNLKFGSAKAYLTSMKGVK